MAFVLASSGVSPVAEAANPSADLDQCANGSAAAPTANACNPTEWVNGNLGASKAHYAEGESIPYRLKFSNLSAGSHNVVIEWDTTKGGKHALDYLTTFNRTVDTANPCVGVSGCAPGTYSTFAIPADPQNSGAGVTAVAGELRLYGGTITGVSAYSYANGAGFTGDKSARLTITFTSTAGTPNPVLAWGGHIATRKDWGSGNSAVAIPGSPYHMRLINLDGSGGNQDRSLSAEAVIFPGSITIIKDAFPNDAQDFSFTASPTPLSNFSLDDDNDITLLSSKVFGNIQTFTTYTIAEASTSGWALSFPNPACTVAAGTANGGSQSSNLGTRSVSITLKEGEEVSCTFVNTQQAASLTVIKHVINDNGGSAVAGNFMMNVTGTAVSQPSFAGLESPGTTVTVTPNTPYSVGETGPAGYAATFSADCSGAGIAPGQTKTCTVTNNDIAPTLTLVKVVVNDNGGTAAVADFPLFIDGVAATSGVAYPVSANVQHTASETTRLGYAASVWGGDCNANGTITLLPGQNRSCTVTNDDAQGTLIVKKVVINDNGGTKVATDFGFKVGSGNTTPFLQDGANALAGKNTLSLNAGTYTITEPAVAGYATTYTDCENVSLGNGETKTCTITNNDIAPTLTVIKVVINDNGGSAAVADFPLFIDGVPATSGVAYPVSANVQHTASETAVPGYTGTIGGDCDATGAITLLPGDNKSCTITNNDLAPSISVEKTAHNALVNAGNQIGFAITVTNNSVFPANEVTLTDALPTVTNQIWSIPSGAAGGSGASFCSINTSSTPNVLSCDFGTLAGLASLTVNVTSPTDANDAGTYTNTATARSDGNDPVSSPPATVVVRSFKLIVITCETTGGANPTYSLVRSEVSLDGAAAVASVTSDANAQALCAGSAGATFSPLAAANTAAPAGHPGAYIASVEVPKP